MVSCLTCWCLWKARNKLLFEETKPVRGSILREIRDLLYYALAAKPFPLSSDSDIELATFNHLPYSIKSSRQRVSVVKWEIPNVGIKINIDAAWTPDSQMCGVGLIVRDAHGQFLRAQTFNCQASSSLEAELKAFSFAVPYQDFYGNAQIIIESDCLNAVSMILNPMTAHWKLFVLTDLISQQITSTIAHTLREANRAADFLAKYALQNHIHTFTTMSQLPPELKAILLLDHVPSLRISP